MMKLALTLFCGTYLFLCSGLEAAAMRARGGAELSNKKSYQIESEAAIFQTSAHFSDDGEEYAMREGANYRLIDWDLKISYGIDSNLEASLLTKLRNVSSSYDEQTANNSGVESVGVMGKYAFKPVNNIRYALGGRYKKTLFTNTVYLTSQIPPADEVILGDDGTEYSVDFYATYLNQRWLLDLLFSYNSPPNDLSSEVVYKLEGRYQFPRLGLFAGVEGIKSLNRDQYTDTPLLKPLMSEGQSQLFNSLNREKLAPFIGASYGLDKYLLTVKGQSIIAGRSTDKGSLISFGITWRSQGISAESIKIDSFKEYHIDGSVLKVSARGNFIKIDQGLASDVEKGSRFDIYQTDYFGGNVLVASGIVHEVGSDWAVIKLTKKYKAVEIKPGFAARGY